MITKEIYEHLRRLSRWSKNFVGIVMCGSPNVAPGLAGFVSDPINQFCVLAKWSGALKVKFDTKFGSPQSLTVANIARLYNRLKFTAQL